MKVVVIGSGAVASALAGAFARSQAELVQVWARNAEAAKKLAASCKCDSGSTPAELAQADLYILAVSDPAIAKCSSTLPFGDAVVAHTAGSVPMGELSNKVTNRAVFYPLQTFTKGRKVDFRNIPILVEGSTPRALKTVKEAATELSKDVREATSAQRLKVHMAAVFACNFANYMYTIGEATVREANFNFDLLKPLILETAAKAASAASPRDVQTGPAIRNDYRTRNRHGELLVSKPEIQNLYTTLSNLIWETSKKR